MSFLDTNDAGSFKPLVSNIVITIFSDGQATHGARASIVMVL